MYGFEGTYSEAAEFIPGKGYWVKVNSGCDLSDYCVGDIRYHTGVCGSSGCSFSSEDCSGFTGPVVLWDTSTNTWEVKTSIITPQRPAN